MILDLRSILTKREREVLRLIARGMKNKDIASKLEIAANTARIHTANIMRKCGVHTRAGLAAMFSSNPPRQVKHVRSNSKGFIRLSRKRRLALD